MARFFVSYSRSVKEEVGKVVALLRAAGHEVWWDGDIPIMADWWRTILEHIEWCEVFVFVASEKSITSAYCLAELKYACDRQRPILPFMLDDPASLNLPPEVPPRNQWLIYNGDPANMLHQINEAYANIDWQLHKDLNVRRPPEPAKGGKSLAKQFQEARRLANEQKYEEATRLFRDVRVLDYGEWGADCDAWIARLTSYAAIVELVDDDATMGHARREWIGHVRVHGDTFDPHNIKLKLKGSQPRRKSAMRRVIGFSAALIVVIVGIAFVLSSRVPDTGVNNPTVEFSPTSETPVAVLASATEGQPVSLVPTETVSATSTPVPPTDTETLAVSSTPTPSDSPTSTYTPSPTYTATPTRTITPSNTPTDTTVPLPTIAIPTPAPIMVTFQPSLFPMETGSPSQLTPTNTTQLTQRPSNTPSYPYITVNVTSAYLRTGPSVTYFTVGYATLGQSFSVSYQSITDGTTWYQFFHVPSNQYVWISGSVVTLSGDPSMISFATDLPPIPTGCQGGSRNRTNPGNGHTEFWGTQGANLTISVNAPSDWTYIIRLSGPSGAVEEGSTGSINGNVTISNILLPRTGDYALAVNIQSVGTDNLEISWFCN